MEAVWTSFFNRVFEIGEAAVQGGLLPVHMLRSSSKACFRALTALTICEAIKRSLDSDGIELATGHHVVAQDVPRQFSRLYTGLERLKSDVKQHINLVGTQWQDVGLVILAAAGVGSAQPPHAMMTSRVSGQYGREVTMLELANWFLYAAREVSKLDMYRTHNQFVLNLLSSLFDPGAPPVVPDPNAGPSAQLHTTAAGMWMTFFNRAYDLGAAALQRGQLRCDDLTNAEPFVFLGLPGVTMLTTVQRSLGEEGQILVTPTGEKVTPDTVPPDARTFFLALVHIKDQVRGARIQENELDILHEKVLLSGAPDRTMRQCPHAEREVELNRITGAIRSVVTDMSRQTAFKQYFANVVDLLADTAEAM